MWGNRVVNYSTDLPTFKTIFPLENFCIWKSEIVQSCIAECKLTTSYAISLMKGARHSGAESSAERRRPINMACRFSRFVHFLLYCFRVTVFQLANNKTLSTKIGVIVVQERRKRSNRWKFPLKKMWKFKSQNVAIIKSIFFMRQNRAQLNKHFRTRIIWVLWTCRYL